MSSYSPLLRSNKYPVASTTTTVTKILLLKDIMESIRRYMIAELTLKRMEEASLAKAHGQVAAAERTVVSMDSCDEEGLDLAKILRQIRQSNMYL